MGWVHFDTYIYKNNINSVFKNLKDALTFLKLQHIYVELLRMGILEKQVLQVSQLTNRAPDIPNAFLKQIS